MINLRASARCIETCRSFLQEQKYWQTPLYFLSPFSLAGLTLTEASLTLSIYLASTTSLSRLLSADPPTPTFLPQKTPFLNGSNPITSSRQPWLEVVSPQSGNYLPAFLQQLQPSHKRKMYITHTMKTCSDQVLHYWAL